MKQLVETHHKYIMGDSGGAKNVCDEMNKVA
jgi:hypothetical protein